MNYYQKAERECVLLMRKIRKPIAKSNMIGVFRGLLRVLINTGTILNYRENGSSFVP